MTTLADFDATLLNGTPKNLADYLGSVVLVVNTASKCGLTPQFEGLQKLYEDFSGDGLVVLGFPCGQFAGQEFTDASEIGDFCQANYGVTFPMFSKINVNGRHQHPLYKWMKHEQRGGLSGVISWNFTKFLIDREGNVIARYSPEVKPDALAEDIRAALDR